MRTDFRETRATTVRWWIVAMLMGWAILGHFNRLSIAVAGNERFIREGLIDEQRMGLVYSMFLIAYTCCMLPAGIFIDRYGPTASLTWMGLAMGLGVALTGTLGWLGWSGAQLWWGLMVVRGLAGIGSTPLHPAAARSISLWIPRPSQTLANGLVTAGALLGIAASYPVFGWLMDRLDWPLAFVVSGGTMVAGAIAWRCCAADHASEHRWSNEQEACCVPRDHLPRQLTIGAALREFVQHFRNRSLLLLSLSYGAVGYFQYLFFYWIEYYFDTTLHMPTEVSRRSSSLVMLAMALGMASGGGLASLASRRWGLATGRRTLAIGGMLLSSLFAFGGVRASEPDLVVAWFCLALGVLGMSEGVFWTTVTDLGGRTGGLAAAFLNTWGNATGAIAPWLTALIMQRYGWDAAIGFACLLCALGGLLWLAFNPAQAAPAGTAVA